MPREPRQLEHRPTRSCVWFTRRNGRWTEHNWPSNFFIEPDRSCVESEFQAEKHAGHPWRQKIILASSPGKAKQLGRKWKLTDRELRRWDKRKLSVMKELIEQKVEDWPEIREALLETDDGIIVESNWWHDNYWGTCTCIRCFRIGKNWLGRIWMEVREELIA